MPQYDAFHEIVKTALVKDGWTITHDPYKIDLGETNLLVDLGVEKILAAEKGARKIAVEIKVFGGVSLFNELEKAVGQYGIYRIFIREIEPDREIYLAVSGEVYAGFFQRESVRKIIREMQIKLMVFSLESEEIEQWIS
jgi:hypothetical protein